MIAFPAQTYVVWKLVMVLFLHLLSFLCSCYHCVPKLFPQFCNSFSIFTYIRKCIFFPLFMAAPAAYGSSQARGWIGAAAAGLCHSHSNFRSKPHQQSTLKLMVTPGPVGEKQLWSIISTRGMALSLSRLGTQPLAWELPYAVAVALKR